MLSVSCLVHWSVNLFPYLSDEVCDEIVCFSSHISVFLNLRKHSNYKGGGVREYVETGKFT